MRQDSRMPADDSPAAARPDRLGSQRPQSADTDLVSEQAHLDESRRGLARMRARTTSMSAYSGDQVSGEYLKYARYQRMQALEDDPEVPLFFGRLDYADQPDPPADAPSAAGERFYIGRRHVTDEAGNPLVIDWRAPISRPFYRASRRDAMGLRLRRRFGFQHGMLTAFEDEPLTAEGTAADAQPAGPPGSSSMILEAEIERPRQGPMRDIVATIQPEQDDIVRADLETSVCVQGAPGTGKTAVGLHRAAYLLYAHRDRLSRQGVLVVGPNASFLRYIADVLPALGEIDARQTTVEDLVATVPVTATDSAALARLKGDARMAEVLSRAVWSTLEPPGEALVVPLGARRWRVPAYQAEEIVTELRTRGVRYGAGRALLPQRLASAILAKMEAAGDSPDDRVQGSVARSRPVKQFTDSIWPAVDPKRLVSRLLREPAYVAQVSTGLLTDAEVVALCPPVPAKATSRKWSLADAVLVDEVNDLVERTPSLGHVVLDEAQDLSPMMLRCVGRRCSTGSATVLGDLAQATTPWAVDDWDTALAHLGKSDAQLEELTLGFRVPSDVLDYATRLLPAIAPTLTRPRAVRTTSGRLRITAHDKPIEAAALAVTDALAEPGSVGVIVPDQLTRRTDAALTNAGIIHSVLGRDDDMEARVDVVPASLAKGLEFDSVVLVEPAEIAADDDPLLGLRRLYVCLTRAVTSLVIVHAKPLPL
jgi:DNA helicase IV